MAESRPRRRPVWYVVLTELLGLGWSGLYTFFYKMRMQLHDTTLFTAFGVTYYDKLIKIYIFKKKKIDGFAHICVSKIA